MKKEAIVIYQKKYERILKKSISNEYDVLLWLEAEIVEKDLVNLGREIKQIYEKNIPIITCLMISQRSLKEEILMLFQNIGINNNSILDVYKAYMAQFPIKRYQRIMEQKGNDKLDGLVLGISHGMAGIIEEMLPGRSCNLCLSSQDLYFNYCTLLGIYQEFYQNIDELKYVIIDMYDYTYFNFDSLLSGAYSSFLEESGFFCEERKNWNKQITPNKINERLQTVFAEGCSDEEQKIFKEVFINMHEYDEDVYKGIMVLKSRDNIITDQEIFEYKTNFDPLSIQRLVFDNTIEFQIANLEKIIKLLQKINPQIKVFLLLMPKYQIVEQYEKKLNVRWKKFFYETIEVLREEYPFIEMLDMKNCEGFSRNKQFYENVTHFNYYGACEFTKYFSTILCDGYGLLKPEEEQNETVEVLVNQLLDSLDNGYINEKTIQNFSYSHLIALLQIANNLENGKAYYLKIKSYLENINIQRLRKKQKIIVGFIANYSATWIGDMLYYLFENNERYEPYVFLISNHNGQSIDMIKTEYEKNLLYFRKRNLRVVQTLDLETGRQYTWEELGIKPEICIWLTPWIGLFREHFHLGKYSLDILHTYIPYGFNIAENESNRFVYHQYNQTLHNISWCNFEDSQISVEMAEKYAFVGAGNVVYTGYPKMDDFFNGDKTGENIWEILVQRTGNVSAKK